MAQKVLVPPLLSADGSTLLTDKDAILKRWVEHFNSVLNRPSSVKTMLSTDCHRKRAMFCLMNLMKRKAIQHISSGKPPGTDAIPAEVYKVG